MVSPSALAVFILMAKSRRAGPWNGNSPVCVPPEVLHRHLLVAGHPFPRPSVPRHLNGILKAIYGAYKRVSFGIGACTEFPC